MNIVSLIKKYKSSVTRKYIFVSKDEIEDGSQQDRIEDQTENDEEKSKLSQFAANLNELAIQGNIDPLIGRSDEIERSIQILCRRRKNNPLLVGEAGVGKTAIAEGLAYRIVKNEVPDSVKNTRLVSLDLGALVAGINNLFV